MGNTQTSSSNSLRSKGVSSHSSGSRDSRNTRANRTRMSPLKRKQKPTTSSGTFGSALEGTSLSGWSTKTAPLTSGGTYTSEITEEEEVVVVVEEEEGEPKSGTTSFGKIDVPTSVYKRLALEFWSNAMGSSNTPNDLRSLEADRQTRLHHLLKFVLKSNYFVPLSSPKNILDCGCGIGIWTVDMAQEYKGCNSIGLDIYPPTTIISTNLNKNISYVAGDLDEPLNFEDNFFDLINQRDMFPCLESKRLVQILTEYKRILKPGGWVQLVERDMYFHCDHPAAQSMNKFLKRALNFLSVNPLMCHTMDRLIEDVGFVNITKRVIEIPVGEWDKREGFAHIGFINRDYLKTAFKSSKLFLMKVNDITSDQYDKLSAEVLEACEANKGYKMVVIVCGQKGTVE